MKILLILFSVLLGTIGQLMFKTAVTGKGEISLFEAARVSFLSFYFWGGVISYSFSLILWMKILADTDLSYARPFAGIGYILTAFAAYFFIGENISISRWAGIVIIFIGVFLVAKT